MSIKARFPDNDIIWKYSDPVKVQELAYSVYGPDAIIYRSRHKNKKYAIVDPNTEKIVNFGQIGFEDVTKHRDINRMYNYLRRATKIKGNWRDNPFSPNNLSINLLWSWGSLDELKELLRRR